MRIIGLMVCGPGEADRYLERSLMEFARLCDDAVIATNNVGEKEKALIRKYGFWQYEDNREWGKDQPNIKTRLLETVSRLNPDWIIALDADETFTPSFTREEAEQLASGSEIAWYFLVVNLYNDESHYAHSNGIQRFWNIRFYKFCPEYGLGFLNKSLHCGLGPPYTYEYGWHAPYYLLHYGLMKPEDRAKKVERYKKYDPKAIYKDKVYYDDLGRALEMRPFDGKKLLRQLAESPDCQPRKTPHLTKQNGEPMNFVYLRRLKDGKVLDIPEKDVEATLKRGFERVPEQEPEIIEEKAPESFLCPLCGWAGKTDVSLKSHKTKKHL